MIYTLVRCKLDRQKFEGALLPLAISTASDDDHANMIYLDFRQRQVRCYLFEPNGITFARTYPDGIQRVRQAWNDVRRTLKDIKKGVRLAGGSGIQTKLGLKSGFVTQGFAICGAITFWVFIEWVNSGVLSFEKFEKLLMMKIGRSEKARVEVQLRVLDFIRKVRQNVEKNYGQKLRKALKKDMKIISKKLKKKFHRKGCKTILKTVQGVTSVNPKVKVYQNATIMI
jgi:hypothetical protein